jgi:hypothetical protein
MAKVNTVLPDFPGFAVEYDPNEKPYFKSQVVEALRLISSKDIGVELLSKIAKARPQKRVAAGYMSQEIKDVFFPAGINVVVVPTSINYVQGGMKMAYGPGSDVRDNLVPSSHPFHNPKKNDKLCRYYTGEGGSTAKALGEGSSDSDGTGCISLMRFTNAQFMTRKGESTHAFIVLAHELIHSYHHVYGIRHRTDEEQKTTGIGKYRDERISENAFRKAFGLSPRGSY